MSESKNVAWSVPVGTVISFFGEQAPDGYLICDGTVYNKADYAELSAHLLSLTNTTHYVVSGDDTKFKVPDLRGEFLRGTGTNGHSGEGNGANVGIHQASTTFGQIFTNPDSNHNAFIFGTGNFITNADKVQATVTTGYYSPKTSLASENASKQTSRPTNTSVLYCIKY